ncbi:MAG: tRNA guanosine(34) transglycosylase Tgt [Puniceicoccales bacterium]|nr:tRNA guanosine(34) transglycosylase Tgt [Puniceicoccales bacterium]
MYPQFSFEITHRSSKSKARCGKLVTPHGAISTPNFVFCGTKGAMKAITAEQLEATGAEIMLANTYHLYLQPGPNVVAENGGLHKMVGWNKPMLTDSGGFQIFSLGHGCVADEIKGRRNFMGTRGKTLLKISEEGAHFRSYIDGRTHCLSPEISIQAQRKIGADIILAFDECTPFHVDPTYTARSMDRSHRWEMRSLREFKRSNDNTQAIYGIIQGGIYGDLRRESAEFVSTNEFFGQAIGGSLGGTKEQMNHVVACTCEHIENNRPTHLLGIGHMGDILNGVKNGIDTFDCVHPTRLARHGGALVDPSTNDGHESININNARFIHDTGPISHTCTCYCCRKFSRSYIHHLFKARENLGGQLLTIHNVHFMEDFMKHIRELISASKI